MLPQGGRSTVKRKAFVIFLVLKYLSDSAAFRCWVFGGEGLCVLTQLVETSRRRKIVATVRKNFARWTGLSPARPHRLCRTWCLESSPASRGSRVCKTRRACKTLPWSEGMGRCWPRKQQAHLILGGQACMAYIVEEPESNTGQQVTTGGVILMQPWWWRRST